MQIALHSPSSPNPFSLGRRGKLQLLSLRELPCTHKSEITDEFKFEYPALPHPNPLLVKERGPVHILPPLQIGRAHV